MILLVGPFVRSASPHILATTVDAYIFLKVVKKNNRLLTYNRGELSVVVQIAFGCQLAGRI